MDVQIIYFLSIFLFSECFHCIFGIDPLTKVGEQKLTFKTPELTDEESKSRTIPESFKCDACKAVTFQVFVVHFWF